MSTKPQKSEQTDYSKTLFLPQTDFPMRAGLPKLEPENLKHWNEIDLYGATLDVAFIGFIREELKFDGIEALIRQMDDDSTKARAMLAAAPDAFPTLGVVG